MTQAASAHLVAQNVSCARGKRVIVSGVDLNVPAGSRLAPVSYTHLTLPTIYSV